MDKYLENIRNARQLDDAKIQLKKLLTTMRFDEILDILVQVIREKRNGK